MIRILKQLGHDFSGKLLVTSTRKHHTSSHKHHIVSTQYPSHRWILRRYYVMFMAGGVMFMGGSQYSAEGRMVF